VFGDTPVITLTEAEDGLVLADEQTFAFRGYNYQGMDFHFDGANWQESQQKTTVNQPPLFDVFDDNGISFGNRDIFVGTSFAGNKLFAYGIGTGIDDPVLGFSTLILILVLALPNTWSSSDGDVVPIPTLPAELIIAYVVPPPLFLK
jgi:hypothetical protein